MSEAGPGKIIKGLVKLVHVSKLEMRGFKSFGHKKVTLPLSSGLTAVVGPNGSGKSNIVDALSFVLGQRSSKTLRASEFSDLIYHGSDGENGKKPAPYAEVKLHVTDDDDSLPIDSEEVTVSRKVNRDGKSTYRINGKRSTRKEIVELLSGEMMGTGGHNFVMQGDVGKFIKMSSRERREIIDELAGVAEFEEKKSKAISELEKVETDLESQKGRLEELEQNMKKLEREREEALKHQDFQEELEEKKASLAKIKIGSYEDKLEDLQGKIDDKNERMEELGDKKWELKDKQNELKNEKKEYESFIEEKRNSEALTKVEKLNSRIETLNESLEDYEESYENLRDKEQRLKQKAKEMAEKREEESPLNKIDKFTEDFSHLYNEFEELSKKVKNAGKDSEEFETSFSQIQRVLSDISDVIGRLHEYLQRSLKSKGDFLQLAEKSDKIEEAGSKFEQLKSKLASTRARKEDAKEQIESLEKKIEESEDSLEEAEEAAQEVREEIEGAKEEIEELDNQISEVNRKYEEIDKKMDGIKDKLNDIKTRRATTETKLDQKEEEFDKYDIEDIEVSMSEEELEEKIKELGKEIEMLEPINERAIDDYGDVKERYDTQKGYHDELMEEKQSLLDFMEKIDQKKTEVFMETFNEVSEHFSDIFGDLSPGGIGRLKLENPEDPFEGGLEIEAKPEGKKLKNAASLSGGEKALTGLAFIFAIQRTRPSALYVFDEIDAHLDPENQKEVANMIKRFSKEAQITVVTLRDPMMAAADKLFGVNMDGNDISHIVSVDLEEYRGEE